jgi:hypothetical protein
MTSLTGRPKVDPERTALTTSIDPRRGAPESTEKKNRKHEDKR